MLVNINSLIELGDTITCPLDFPASSNRQWCSTTLKPVSPSAFFKWYITVLLKAFYAKSLQGHPPCQHHALQCQSMVLAQSLFINF